MNLNKIGNILCIFTGLFLSVIGAAAIMMLIIMSPSMLENVASEYIIPFAAGQMTATFTFVLAEMLLVVSVIGKMSPRNRRNGFLGVAATAVFLGVFTTLILVVFDALAGVGGDAFMMIIISISFYVAVGLSLVFLLGSSLKILHKE